MKTFLSLPGVRLALATMLLASPALAVHRYLHTSDRPRPFPIEVRGADGP